MKKSQSPSKPGHNSNLNMVVIMMPIIMSQSPSKPGHNSNTMLLLV
ncbi:hypothetical protein MHK_002466 [Candidatus Magnetomorum sp. HK-1]|nr:hypothetical protein MHK_002466 [Candidatus Magnetomorum sp. HK-1]